MVKKWLEAAQKIGSIPKTGVKSIPSLKLCPGLINLYSKGLNYVTYKLTKIVDLIIPKNNKGQLDLFQDQGIGYKSRSIRRSRINPQSLIFIASDLNVQKEFSFVSDVRSENKSYMRLILQERKALEEVELGFQNIQKLAAKMEERCQ